MPNYRNAVLAGLAVACVLFICLDVGARFQPLAAAAVSIAGGGVVLGALSKQPRQLQHSDPVGARVANPPPVQFQARTIVGLRLPSAVADYDFAFTANVIWAVSAPEISGAGDIAVTEIIRRAREFAKRQDPAQATLIGHELAALLGELRHDPGGQLQVKADSVQLQLPPEDQQRLEEHATLRKQNGLLQFRRRFEVSNRRYLRTDVLKDTGSAVVWWFARHEEDPEGAANRIDVLDRLARAANNAGGAGYGMPAAPPTAADRFDAFVDSLDPVPDDDFRRLLTEQVARFVDNHDQKAADEMRRHGEPDYRDSSEDYWDSADEL
jgi:hypothetical protein